MDVGKRIGELRQLRAKMKEISDRHKEELAPYVEAEALYEGKLLDYLNQSNQQNAKTLNGTAYKYEKISYRVEDPDAFKRHVIGAEDWEAINWAVNKSRADDEFAKTKQLLPGTTRTVLVTLGVLAPPKPRTKKVKETETTLSEEDLNEIDAALAAE